MPTGGSGERDERGRWSPYVAGALTGILIVLSAATTGNYFGASTSFVRTAGMLERLLDAGRVAQMSYFLRFAPRIDWQWVFLVGILLGSAASAAQSGSFRLRGVPPMWEQRFGSNPALRAAAAFAGGVAAMFGARIAGG